MQRVFLFVSLTFFALAVAQFVAAESESRGKQIAQRENDDSEVDAQAQGKHADDEAEIRANVAAFVKAYDAKQSKQIASLFLQDGQIITEEGETIEGRDAIEQQFNDVFAETPQAKIEIAVDSIRFVGSDLAIEIGSTKESSLPGEAPEYGRYTVLHVKRDGKWQMALARDTEGESPTNHERLLPLAWLVGEWIDDDGSSVVRTTCRWSDDKNFLLQEMNLQIAGQDAMQVTQRIGWDALQKCIRSWTFDTEGGFSEGVWTRNEDSWVIKSTGVRNDGTAASATSVIVPTGTDGYVWRVGDRVAGDEVLPSVEVKVVRNPPTPKN